ncbi:hypothetical protein JMG10_29605 [Nostoc ellipsosporum NOK]|nr:hypothetical protein [Nostoc ellipsosporum NOK]
MRGMIKSLLCLLAGAVAYVLFNFALTSVNPDPYRWMAAVIVLGCMGAAFTITRVRREDS